MSSSDQPRWLNAVAVARYICVRVDAVSRLVKLGRLPEPDRALGVRSPRWDGLAIDAAFSAAASRDEAKVAFERLAGEIAAKANTRRRK